MQHDEPTREQSHDRYFIAGCDSFYQELEADPFTKREEYRGADQILSFRSTAICTAGRDAVFRSWIVWIAIVCF